MQFSDTTQTPIRVEPNGTPVMPEWSDADPKPAAVKTRTRKKKGPQKLPRKRTPKELQPDASQMENLTEAAAWLKAHPEEAAMLRSAQAVSTGDILSDAGISKRYYSSTEAASFFDKSVQWLYWGMRHPPHGGRLFIEPVPARDPDTGEPLATLSGAPIYLLDAEGRPLMHDIPVERIGDPNLGKRRFDIDTIRRFAKSAYHQANIKEPKLRAVLERLVVAEHGGNWKAVPIPKRKDEVADGPN